MSANRRKTDVADSDRRGMGATACSRNDGVGINEWAAARDVLRRVGRTIRVSAVQRYPKALPQPPHLLLAN
jgi:hypothetical protein